MDFRTEARALGLLALALALFGAFAPYKWHDMPAAVTDGALLLAALCAIWALWVILPKRWLTKRARMNSYLVVAAIFAVCSASALIDYWLDWRGGPMQWDFDFPLSLSRTPNGPVTVGGFQISGHNTSDNPIRVKAAYIRSDITSHVVPLVVGIPGGNLDASEAVIKPSAEVRFWGDYPGGPRPAPIDRVLEEFGRFTFVFEYEDGRVYRKNFGPGDIGTMISTLDKRARDTADKGPGVIRK
jgi:hypothetical protein